MHVIGIELLDPTYKTRRNLLVFIIHHSRSKKLKLKLIDTWMKYIVYFQK